MRVQRGTEYDALTAREKLRLGTIMIRLLKAYEAIFRLREEGALDGGLADH